MRARRLILLLLAFSTSAFAQPSPDGLETIRVRLVKDAREVALAGMRVRWGKSVARLSPPFTGRWELAADTKSILIRTATGKELSLPSEKIVVSGEFLRLNGKPAPGRLSVSRSARGLDVIAELNMRDYLVGVVAHEMPIAWPLETLKAQAVAARSYALAVREERELREWDVETTIEDQAFGVIESPATKATNAFRAVRETDGQVLRLPPGRILKAFYHSHCGGRTLSAREVWGGGPDAGVAVDPSCPGKMRWTASYAVDDLNRRFQDLLAPQDRVADVLSLTARSGRTRSVQLISEQGTKLLAANEFRRRLGYGEFKSTAFRIDRRGERWVFEGTGFGHGVGMCQWGSRALGLDGRSSDEILKHYYPRATRGSLEIEQNAQSEKTDRADHRDSNELR